MHTNEYLLVAKDKSTKRVRFEPDVKGSGSAKRSSAIRENRYIIFMYTHMCMYIPVYHFMNMCSYVRRYLSNIEITRNHNYILNIEYNFGGILLKGH